MITYKDQYEKSYKHQAYFSLGVFGSEKDQNDEYQRTVIDTRTITHESIKMETFLNTEYKEIAEINRDITYSFDLNRPRWRDDLDVSNMPNIIVTDLGERPVRKLRLDPVESRTSDGSRYTSTGTHDGFKRTTTFTVTNAYIRDDLEQILSELMLRDEIWVRYSDDEHREFIKEPYRIGRLVDYTAVNLSAKASQFTITIDLKPYIYSGGYVWQRFSSTARQREGNISEIGQYGYEGSAPCRPDVYIYGKGDVRVSVGGTVMGFKLPSGGLGIMVDSENMEIYNWKDNAPQGLANHFWTEGNFYQLQSRNPSDRDVHVFYPSKYGGGALITDSPEVQKIKEEIERAKKHSIKIEGDVSEVQIRARLMYL